MFAKDAKNYHVWSYRQWLVRHFSLWDSELPYLEKLLQEDVRNNSAWNHRWFVVFGRYDTPNTGSDRAATGQGLDPEVIKREIDYTKSSILLAPQNQSPWNYLRGVLKRQGRGLGDLKGFAQQFADLDKEDEVRSSHALDFLADLYAEQKEQQQAGKALELLARRYDPIRKNYWNYRRGLLGLGEVAV
jgi:protein farnesyltransferase/geranylgeranyltransferase type-1 subunit alpha